MANNNRPVGRKKTYGTGGGNAKKTGSGLGTGPVGSGARPGSSSGSTGSTGSGFGTGSSQRSGGRGFNPLLLIILAVILFGGGGGLSSLLGGGGGSGSNSGSSLQTVPSSTQSTTSSYSGTQSASTSQGAGSVSQSSSGVSLDPSVLSSLFGQTSSSSPYGSFGSLFSSDWGSYTGSSSGSSGSTLQQVTPQASGTASQPVYAVTNNTGSLDTNVATAARKRYTTIKGNQQDTVTIMVYMCGADLESRSGMATKDIMEMVNADLTNLNVILYTGGAKQWNNNIISNQRNQIYRVQKGGLEKLEDNAGTGAMTHPDTLASFIQYCAKNFPANRNELIFWDHGGGSISGYGYDEKNSRAGSMNLSGISQALKKGGVKFDIIGFDTCLMATAENALMLTGYGDYMVASEESEPGIGWYYTDWLTKFSRNTSMPSVEIGRNIIDDFVNTCATQCRGQKATLSVTDLAELQMTVPVPLKAFSRGTTELIKNNEYKTVSNARYSAREFAQSSRIDQVDFIDLAQKIGTEESVALAKALAGTIKYNRTSSNMTNAYGLSVYFPYARVSQVNSAVQINNAIGFDEDYSKLLQEFASVETSGQVAAGGSYSPLSSLFGDLTGMGGSGSTGSSSGSSGSSAGGLGGLGSLGGSSSGNYDSAELIQDLLGSFLGGGFEQVSGLSESNSGFLFGRDLSTAQVSEYIMENHFDPGQLQWSIENGYHILRMTEEQWNLVHDLELNVYVDDGEGFVDLGLDNTYLFTEDGGLIGDMDGTWLSLDGQICAYYYMDTMVDGDNYAITGYVPALLNGERVNLMLVFDSENEEGYVAGYRMDYKGGETSTVAKTCDEIVDGDVIQCLCDYYAYDGTYLDSYILGDPIVVDGDILIRNDPILAEGDTDTLSVTYRLTDIYNQNYWMPAFTQQ